MFVCVCVCVCKGVGLKKRKLYEPESSVAWGSLLTSREPVAFLL